MPSVPRGRHARSPRPEKCLSAPCRGPGVNAPASATRIHLRLKDRYRWCSSASSITRAGMNASAGLGTAAGDRPETYAQLRQAGRPAPSRSRTAACPSDKRQLARPRCPTAPPRRLSAAARPSHPPPRHGARAISAPGFRQPEAAPPAQLADGPSWQRPSRAGPPVPGPGRQRRWSSASSTVARRRSYSALDSVTAAEPLTGKSPVDGRPHRPP